MPLEPEDLKILQCSAGYAQLGMFAEAQEQLDSLRRDAHEEPEALAVLAEIHRGHGRWSHMQTVASQLADLDPENPQWPISRAYATRRAVSIEAAKPILVEATQLHPKEPVIWFNLACYECQTGNLNAAREYLQKAVRLDPKCRIMALEDDDLRPLHDMFRTLDI
jgi:Flp pilus assembly protein TadD